MKKYLYVIAAIFLIAGCGKKEAAIVNKKVIYEKDIQENMKDINKDTIARIGEDNLKQNILDGLIDRQLLLLKIKEENFESTEKIRKIWIPYLKDLTYKYLINTYLPENHPLSKSVLSKEYKEKKEMFKTEGQIRARHILIRTGNGQHSDKDAQDKISAIGKELKKDGSNFADIAKKYSECPSAKNGGDLNYISRGQMVKPFEDAVFSMKKGEVTENPVKTEYGYHLIYAEDVKEPSYPPLEEVKQYFMPDIYLRNMISEYGLVLYTDKDKEKTEYIGEIKKIELKYTSEVFKEDIEKIKGKDGAANFFTDNKDNSKIIREFLLQKIFDDKIKVFAMEKDENYLKFVEKVRNELLTNTYLTDVTFKNVLVTDAEVQEVYSKNYPREFLVQQFGSKFNDDASYRRKTENELIFPELKRRISDQKKNELYLNLINGLKKKYNIEIKIKYKTT